MKPTDGMEPRTPGAPSPYEAADIYDLTLDAFRDDIPFWLGVAREAGGPVLEVSCGTGRVLLELLAAGIDADGLDLHAPMLDRLRAKAAARGLKANVLQSDMRDFAMPRKYRRILIPFNGFAHCDTTDDQIAALRRCYSHLEHGGATVLHMSYPSLAYWNEVDGTPVLEIESKLPETGHRMQLWDNRFRDRVRQMQRSEMEARELDAEGRPLRSYRFEATQRWVYRYELELLFRVSGYSRWEIFGGFDRRPLERDDDQMMAFGWKD